MSETGDGFDHLRIPFEKIKFGNKLETQGYGTVFEGEFDDQRVALKQLNITNLANVKPKLLSEILTISLFRQHPNLVALLGFCDEKLNEIILVYEYVASGNLADKMRKRLNTIQRFEICLGAARGLHYLHTGVESVSIVHGNVNPFKILLNSVADSKRFEAKVSSFGLSKIVPGKTQTQESCDEVEKPTKESDVYSFGVVLLEVLCGVSELVDTDDYQERHVTELVPKKMAQNKLQKVVHFDIRKEIKPEALETYAKIACRCVVEDPDARPLMGQVVEELEKALRLQGGEVTNVQLRGNGNIAQATDETVLDGLKGDRSEEDAKDLTVGERSVDAGEVNGKEVNVIDTTLESSNGEKHTESVPSETRIENAKIENGSDDQVTEREILHDLKSEKESNITVEDEQDVHKETSTIDPESIEEAIDDFDSNKESNIIEENKEDDKSIEVTSTSESDGDTSTLTNQGGKATDVEIVNGSNGNGLVEGAIDEVNNNCEMISSDITGEESKVVKETVDDTNPESEPIKSHIENAKNENSNDDQVTEREVLIDLKSEKEPNIPVENEQVVQTEISTIDPESIEEAIDDFDSNKESSIIEENKFDKSIEVSSTSESNGDTSTLTNQEADESNILKSDIEDGLDHLRIPFDKIKFGEKIDVRGYGTLFKGEYNDRQVALKRLNITNLGNIKPKLLSAILTISRFRKHPNLVALIGFCDENDKEIILVYEYVSGGNLADNMSKHLTTIQRLQICLGAARGVEYLHGGDEPVDSKPVIIHGDLKLTKILLNPDQNSSNFNAKVSGFGLPKVFPGHVEISPKSMDPVHAATGKLTKESDVYTFGVLLLEVLCGVPELVDTDDYQERHVTEVVPKRLEQNTLRKIVHFDMRNEITTESLETYAKIACRCVMKNPEERPTMSEVVVELEKALRLQGGEVTGVQIFDDSNGNGLAEVPIGEGDHEGDDNGETKKSDITEEQSKVVEETIDDTNLCESKDVESVPEDAETKKSDILNDNGPEEVIADLKSNEESKISVEDEVSNENSNGNDVPEVSVDEDVQECDDNGETVSSTITDKVTEETTDDIARVDTEKENGETDNVNVPENVEENKVDLKSIEESKIDVENEVHNESKIESHPDEKSDHEDATKEIMEEQNSAVPDGDAKAGLLNTGKPELVVNIRGDISNSVIQTKESESKRSNSTCSESSNGDDTTPSDLLLPKTPDKVTKISTGSRSCCSCSWWQYICSRSNK